MVAHSGEGSKEGAAVADCIDDNMNFVRPMVVVEVAKWWCSDCTDGECYNVVVAVAAGGA